MNNTKLTIQIASFNDFNRRSKFSLQENIKKYKYLYEYLSNNIDLMEIDGEYLKIFGTPGKSITDVDIQNCTSYIMDNINDNIYKISVGNKPFKLNNKTSLKLKKIFSVDIDKCDKYYESLKIDKDDSHYLNDTIKTLSKFIVSIGYDKDKLYITYINNYKIDCRMVSLEKYQYDNIDMKISYNNSYSHQEKGIYYTTYVYDILSKETIHNQIVINLEFSDGICNTIVADSIEIDGSDITIKTSYSPFINMDKLSCMHYDLVSMNVSFKQMTHYSNGTTIIKLTTTNSYGYDIKECHVVMDNSSYAG